MKISEPKTKKEVFFFVVELAKSLPFHKAIVFLLIVGSKAILKPPLSLIGRVICTVGSLIKIVGYLLYFFPNHAKNEITDYGGLKDIWDFKILD